MFAGISQDEQWMDAYLDDMNREEEERAHEREEEICVDCEEGIVHLHKTPLPF